MGQSGNEMGSLKILKVEVLKLFLNIVYWLCSLFLPYQKNAVLLLSSRSDRMSVGMEMLDEELVKDESIELTSFFYGRNLSQIELLKCSVKAVSLIAKHHVIVVDDHCVPLNALYWKHKRNVAIQIWHAAGTFKKFGNLKDTRTRIPHKNYDIVCVNSEEDSKIYAQALGVKASQIRITGALQLYWTLKQKKIKRLENQKELIVYAPTYRSSKQYMITVVKEFIAYWRKKESSKFDLLISLHPYVDTACFSVEEDVVFISGKGLDLVSRADVFITDYSSLVVEYSFFDNPILLYTPDYRSYIDEFDFIDDITESGFFKCHTPEEIFGLLRNNDKKTFITQNEKVRTAFQSKEARLALENVCSVILKQL